MEYAMMDIMAASNVFCCAICGLKIVPVSCLCFKYLLYPALGIKCFQPELLVPLTDPIAWCKTCVLDKENT